MRVLVFENYTLPGVDFGNNRDEEVIETIKNHFKSEFQENITFVAMRDTFNLNLNHPFTTLCAYGFREESSQAIVNMLINYGYYFIIINIQRIIFNRIKSPIRGISFIAVSD